MAITITEEIIKNADAYIPLAKKAALTKFVAPMCVEKVKISALPSKSEDEDETDLFPMPDMAKENIMNKSRLLMGILAVCYLHLDFEAQLDNDGDPIECLPTFAAYDEFASSSIFNQMERMKQSKTLDQEIKNKVFDLLYDYKAMQIMLSTEIYNLIQIQSDVPTRIMAMIAMQTTPKVWNKALNALESDEDINAVEAKRAELKDLTGRSTPLPKNVDRQKIVHDIKENKRADKAAEKFLRDIQEIASSAEVGD